MKSDSGQPAVPAAFTGFVVAEEHHSSLDRLRAELSVGSFLADAAHHIRAALAAMRDRLQMPGKSVRSRLPGAVAGFDARRYCQNGFDLVAGAGLLLLLLVLMSFRTKPRRKAGSSARLTSKKRYYAFHTGIVVTLLALGAAVLIPERDSSVFFGAIAPSKAGLVTEHLRSEIPDAIAPASVRATIALPFAPQDEMPWVPVKRPVSMFSLEGPEVDGSELDYRVFTRGPSARQDTLSFTPRRANVASKPQVHLVIERFEASRPTSKPLFADIAARAADRHASLERMSPPADLPSKFGPVQIAEAVIGQGGAAQGCLVFRRIDMAGLTLAGWYCAPAKRPVNRVELTCFLNRLDLASAGNDSQLKQIFAQAERQRSACASTRQAGRKTTWLDHEAPVPPLKLNAKPR